MSRHVKSLHKNTEFEREKCRKKFNRAEHLRYHKLICGKCRRCEVQFATLADFAAHTCEAPAKKKRRLDDSPLRAVPVGCSKTPVSSSTEAHGASLPIPRKQSKKAGNSPKSKQYRRNWRCLEFVEGEGLEEDDEEMRAFLRTQWSSVRLFTRRGAVQDLYNFYYNSNYKDMVLNILSSIIQNQINRFKINYSLGYVLRNIKTDQFRYYHPSHNNAQVLDNAVLISSAEELVEFLYNISEENFSDTLSRPDTRWKFVQLTNITFYVYKLKVAPLGAPILFPDFLRFNRGLANVPGNDNLCFFCCLAIHKGTDRERCEREAKQFFTAFCERFAICNFTGVELFDLPNLEDFFKLNIVVYEREDAVATLVQRSRDLYRETMRLNLRENHFSLIADFEKYCRVFKCTRCDKLWYERRNYTQHTKICSATEHESHPGGIYKNTSSIFEKLEDIGICVSQNIRHYPFYACFDFECYFSTESLPRNGEMLSFEARHVPLSVGITSNIPGYEEAVCYISDGNESDLVKKMVDYLNKLSDTAFEILQSKYQHVFEVFKNQPKL